MFLVFNKSKIYSYVIALSMVLILFVAAAKLNDVVSPTNDLIETSANVVDTNNCYDINSNIMGNNIKNNITNE